MRSAAWTLMSLLVACAAQRPQPSPPEPVPAVATASASASPQAPAVVLDVRIQPVGAPPAVRVEVQARGEPKELAEWQVAGESVSELELRDDSGTLPSRQERVAGGIRVRLERAAVGAVVARYSVAGGAFSSKKPVLPALDAQRFRADGAGLLLLPSAYATHPVATRLRLDPSAFGPAARAASSFGLGAELRVEASGEALARATFVAGALGHAEFDGPEGIDRAAWSGLTAFDPRQVAAEIAGFRSGAREYFASRRVTPSMLLVLGDDRSAGEFAATRRTASVLVEVGAGQQWTGALRLATAQQVLREWIGAELAVEPVDAAHPFESAWLSDGVNRTVARELLFRFGLLTPEEYRDEVEQLIALHVTSPVLRVPLHALAGHADRPSAETSVVVRGALYATLLDALIREKSKNAFGLDDLLRELFTAARSRGGPLPPKAVTDAVGNFLGADRALELESRYLRGDETIVLPAHALGRCFRAGPASYPSFALGFSPEADESSGPRAANVDPKGPAARAGLKSGERIQDLSYVAGRTDVEVVLRVRRNGGWKRLSYLPLGAAVRAQGFARVPGVRDEHCALRR